MRIICILVLIFVYYTSEAQLVKEFRDGVTVIEVPFQTTGTNHTYDACYKWEWGYIKDGKYREVVVEEYFSNGYYGNHKWTSKEFSYNPLWVKVTFMEKKGNYVFPIDTFVIDDRIILQKLKPLK